MVCMKTSRKVHSHRPPSNRPPSSRSVSQQKAHHLANAAVSARPPSVFNKNPLLPPIGTAAAAATSLSPGSDSSASVPLDLSATPAAETWSRARCSSKGASVSSLANSTTATPNADDLCAPAAACCHHPSMPTEAPVTEASSKHESRHNGVAAAAGDQQRAACPSLTADSALGGEPSSSRTSRLAVKLSTKQLNSKATDGCQSDVPQFKPDCSLAAPDMSENIVDLPLLSPGSAQLKVTDAACQCDELLSDVKSRESRTHGNDDNNKHLSVSAAGANDVSSSVAHPLSDKTKSVDWWSNELVTTTSILGFSPSPTYRLRSGASSRTARKFHGLNAHEMQTVSNVLNTLARSQSRAAAGPAVGTTPAPIAAAISTAERVPTAERLRLTVSSNGVTTTAFNVNFV